MNKWIIFQVGSREYYALPRMFFKNNNLQVLVTDIWLKPDHLFSKLILYFFPKSKSRFHPDLKNANVVHWNSLFITIQVLRKIPFFAKRISYDSIVKRLFCKFLEKSSYEKDSIFFSYNYVASEIFKIANRKGYKCILGQIDAGPLAGEINRNLFKEVYNGKVEANPDLYMLHKDQWLNECELASKIIVNSEWSKSMLVKAGIEENKLNVIELAYERPPESQNYIKNYPDLFTLQRPLRVLFLGSLKLLKGIKPLLDAIRNFKEEPIEFYLVGSLQIKKELIMNLPDNCIITGVVEKGKTAEFYKLCDILVLPTYSDGFAMTQLEAQAWKMPIIASERCGKVITDNVNGLILKEITSNSIVNAINTILEKPRLLKSFSEQSIDLDKYSLDFIYKKYSEL